MVKNTTRRKPAIALVSPGGGSIHLSGEAQKTMRALLRGTQASLDGPVPFSTEYYPNLPEYNSVIIESPTRAEFDEDIRPCIKHYDGPYRGSIFTPPVQQVGGSENLFYIKYLEARKSDNALLVLGKKNGTIPQIIRKIPTNSSSRFQVIAPDRILEMIPGDEGYSTYIGAIDINTGRTLFKLDINSRDENIRHIGFFMKPDGKELLLIEEELYVREGERKVIHIDTLGLKEKRSKSTTEKKTRTREMFKKMQPECSVKGKNPYSDQLYTIEKNADIYTYTYNVLTIHFNDDDTFLQSAPTLSENEQPHTLYPYHADKSHPLTRALSTRLQVTMSDKEPEKALIILEHIDDVAGRQKLVVYSTGDGGFKPEFYTEKDLLPSEYQGALVPYRPLAFSTIPALSIPLSTPVRETNTQLVRYIPGSFRNLLAKCPHITRLDSDSHALTRPRTIQTLDYQPITAESMKAHSKRDLTDHERQLLNDWNREQQRFWKEENNRNKEDNRRLSRLPSAIFLCKPDSNDVNCFVTFDNGYEKIFSSRINQTDRKVYAMPVKEKRRVDGLVVNRIHALPLGRFTAHISGPECGLINHTSAGIKCYLLDDGTLITVPILGDCSVHFKPASDRSIGESSPLPIKGQHSIIEGISPES